MIIALTLLVALIGLIIHLASNNPKVQVLGLPTYFAGLLAFLLVGYQGLITLVGTHYR